MAILVIYTKEGICTDTLLFYWYNFFTVVILDKLSL